jgi:AraC-like DNA-binding protein
MSFQPKSATILRGRYEWAQYAPNPVLAAWVSSYWSLETGSGRHLVRSLPDACVDLTIRRSGVPGAFVSGPQPRAETWPLRGRVHLLGARMLPGAAALLGIDVEALAPGWTPLARFLPAGAVARLIRAVTSAAGVEARVTVLDAFLADRLLNRELDARLSAALRLVFARKGHVAVNELARAAGAHVRTLTRLFERSVGLTPKRFVRVVRFQAAMRALPGGRGGAELAAELGYADQAHFIRDVRELFGASPREALKLAGRTQ